MVSFRRQATNFVKYDDQGPVLWNAFVGNWTRSQQQGASNNTLTSAQSPRGFFSFTFSGTQVWLVGGLLNITDAGGNYLSYPTGDYWIDGVPAGSQHPIVDRTQNRIIYFQTPVLPDVQHKIDVAVTAANETNVFIVDYVLITPSLAGGGQSGLPIGTTKSTPVGAIVGGVVGGIAGVSILVGALLWYFLRKRSHGGQAYYFEKPTPAEILAIEGHIEPFDMTTLAPSSAGFSGPGSQPAYPDSPWSPSFGEVAASPNPSYVSSNSVQPKVGQPTLIQNQDVRRPTQRDSGTRFIENEEQVAGPSRLHNEVPPTYSPD